MTYKQGWPWGGEGVHSFARFWRTQERLCMNRVDIFSARHVRLDAGICFTPRLTVVRVVQLC